MSLSDLRARAHTINQSINQLRACSAWDTATSTADAAVGAMTLLRCERRGDDGDVACRIGDAAATEAVATAVRDRMAAARGSLGVFGFAIRAGTVRALLVVAVTNVGSFLYTRLK